MDHQTVTIILLIIVILMWAGHGIRIFIAWRKTCAAYATERLRTNPNEPAFPCTKDGVAWTGLTKGEFTRITVLQDACENKDPVEAVEFANDVTDEFFKEEKRRFKGRD